MPQQDPFLAGLPNPPAASSPLAAAPAPIPTTQSDPFLSGLGKTPEAAEPTQTAKPDPFLAKLPEAPKPDQGFIGKAWDWANTPLINLNKSNEGGFTGGAEDVVSGLTSPLSIGLTAATLGSGAVLRGLGIAAEEMPVAIRGIKSLIDAGFTAQGAVQVVKESPQVLDALKEGDYDTAKRLAVHVVAGTAMTAIGATHLATDSSPIIDPIKEGLGFKVKPSETNRQLAIIEGEGAVTKQKINDWYKTWAEGLEKDPRFKNHTSEDNAAAFHLIQADGNVEKLIDRKNALMESAGRPDLKVGATAAIPPELKPLEDRGLIYRGDFPEGHHDFQDSTTGGSVYIPKNATGINSEGRILYHGSKAAVESASDLDSEYAGKPGLTGIGSYFTDKPEVASAPRYGGGKNGRVVGARIPNSANILDGETALPDAVKSAFDNHIKDLSKQLFEGEDVSKEYFGAAKTYIDYIKGFKNMLAQHGEDINGLPQYEAEDFIKNFQDEASKLGYDGVRYDGGKRVGGLGPHEAIMVFPGKEKIVSPETPRKANLLEEANAHVDAHRAAVGDVQKLDPSLQEKQQSAAERWSELKALRDQSAKLKLKENYTPKEIERVSNVFDKAIDAAKGAPGTESIRDLAKEVGDQFDFLGSKAHDAGIIKSWIEDYITHIWKKEDQNHPAANLLRDDSNLGKFRTTMSQARQRIFKHATEGMLFGKKLLTDQPVPLVRNYANSMAEAIANREIQEKILNLRASDGSPGAMLSGAGNVLEDENGVSTILANPNTTRNVVIGGPEMKALRASGDFDRLVEQERIVKASNDGSDHYVWNSHGYKRTGGLEDWQFAGRDKNTGTRALVKANYVVHPEMYDMVNRLLGNERSPVKDIKPLNWLLNASKEAKATTLSFSWFHAMQLGLRSLMGGVIPGSLKRMDINESPDLARGVKMGLERGKEYLNLHDFQKDLAEGLGGHSKTIDAIGRAGDKLGVVGKPLSAIRDVQNYITDFTFDRLMPMLKEQNFLKLNERWKDIVQDDQYVEKLQKAHPEYQGLSKEDIAAKLAATETNERFGGLNYRQMGRAVGTQDFLRLTTLAPDWLESEFRSLKRVFDPTGGVLLRRDLVRLTAGMWMTARILNMLSSGKMHNEAPFGYVHTDADGKEKVYSLRTLPTDMLHAATDPLGFMRGRISPLGRTGLEAGTGRDYQGRKMSGFDTAVDIVRNNFAPIGLQSIAKGVTGTQPDLTTADQAVKAAGLTVNVYRTEAQKLANELSANKNEQGPVDTHKLAQHRAVAEVEDKIRSGQVSKTVLNDLHEQGLIGKSEVKRIDKVIKETAGMDPEQAKLYSQANRLGMPDFLSVWDKSTPAEQALLTRTLIAKRKSYIDRIQKEFPSNVWASDPTYQRLKSMFPSAPNY